MNILLNRVLAKTLLQKSLGVLLFLSLLFCMNTSATAQKRYKIMLDVSPINFSRISNHPYFLTNFSPVIKNFRFIFGFGGEATFHSEDKMGFSVLTKYGMIFKEKHGVNYVFSVPLEHPLLEYGGVNYQYEVFDWKHLHLVLDTGIWIKMHDGKPEKIFNAGLIFRTF